MLIYYIYINIIIYTHILYTYIYNIYFSYVPLSLSSTSFKLPAVSHSPRNYRVISSYVEATLREIRLYRCTMSIGYQCQRWKLYRSIKIYMNHRCSSRTKRIKGIRKLKIKKNNKKKICFRKRFHLSSYDGDAKNWASDELYILCTRNDGETEH